jgi:hypothetical protein
VDLTRLRLLLLWLHCLLLLAPGGWQWCAVHPLLLLLLGLLLLLLLLHWWVW